MSFGAGSKIVLASSVFSHCLNLFAVDNYPLVNVSFFLFAGCSQLNLFSFGSEEPPLSTLKISSTIVKIDYGSFRSTGFQKIDFSSASTLQQVFNYAFSACANLKSVTHFPLWWIAGSLFKDSCVLDTFTFLEQTEVESVLTIPSTIQSIGDYTFSGTSFKEVKFGFNSELANVYGSVFSNSESLVSVFNWPLRTIPSEAFTNCPNLKNFISGESFRSTGCSLTHIDIVEYRAFHTPVGTSFPCVYPFAHNINIDWENDYLTKSFSFPNCSVDGLATEHFSPSKSFTPTPTAYLSPSVEYTATSVFTPHATASPSASPVPVQSSIGCLSSFSCAISVFFFFLLDLVFCFDIIFIVQ